MRVFYDDHHPLPLPPRHRFPIAKYGRVRAALVDRGIVAAADLCASDPAPVDAVLTVHARAYVTAVLDGALDHRAIRALGFPWSAELVTWALAGVGGTLGAARAALANGVGGNLGGGNHHAAADRCGGFCLFNDLAIATTVLLAEGAVARVLILDVDVHQGDGTAEILAAEPRAFTCSLHSAQSYPFDKKRSDRDVALPDGADDEAFLAALRDALAAAIDHARPDLLLYQAGVDALREDRMGRLSMTHSGLRERDRFVFDTARRLGIPVAITLGGGYAVPIDISVEAHVATYAIARELLAGARL